MWNIPVGFPEMAGKKAKKKGGSKLPMILALVVVLGGGGFFMMNKGKAEEPEEPPIELGAVEDLGGEFLINLRDGRTYLKCTIAAHVAKDGHVSDPTGDEKGGHGKGDASYAIARSAVIELLSSKTMDELTQPDGLKHLKRELAAAINARLPHEEDKDEKESDDKSKKKKKKEDEEEDHGHGPAKIDHEWLDELGWDAEEGPVLKIYFTDFVYRKY